MQFPHPLPHFCSLAFLLIEQCACCTHNHPLVCRQSGLNWIDAHKLCARRCEQCERCRYVSLSIRWNDCSWFHSCDTTRLLEDIADFRTYEVRPSPAVLSATVQPKGVHKALRLMTRNLSAISGGHSCWVPRCGSEPSLSGLPDSLKKRRHSRISARGGDRTTSSSRGLLVSVSYNGLDHKESDYGHLWRSLETIFQCIVQVACTTTTQPDS